MNQFRAHSARKLEPYLAISLALPRRLQVLLAAPYAETLPNRVEVPVVNETPQDWLSTIRYAFSHQNALFRQFVPDGQQETIDEVLDFRDHLRRLPNRLIPCELVLRCAGYVGLHYVYHRRNVQALSLAKGKERLVADLLPLAVVVEVVVRQAAPLLFALRRQHGIGAARSIDDRIEVLTFPVLGERHKFPVTAGDEFVVRPEFCLVLSLQLQILGSLARVVVHEDCLPVHDVYMRGTDIAQAVVEQAVAFLLRNNRFTEPFNLAEPCSLRLYRQRHEPVEHSLRGRLRATHGRDPELRHFGRIPDKHSIDNSGEALLLGRGERRFVFDREHQRIDRCLAIRIVKAELVSKGAPRGHATLTERQGPKAVQARHNCADEAGVTRGVHAHQSHKRRYHLIGSVCSAEALHRIDGAPAGLENVVNPLALIGDPTVAVVARPGAASAAEYENVFCRSTVLKCLDRRLGLLPRLNGNHPHVEQPVEDAPHARRDIHVDIRADDLAVNVSQPPLELGEQTAQRFGRRLTLRKVALEPAGELLLGSSIPLAVFDPGPLLCGGQVSAGEIAAEQVAQFVEGGGYVRRLQGAD